MKKEAVKKSDDLERKITELQTMLKAAAVADEKKTAMLEEFKVAIQSERESLSK